MRFDAGDLARAWLAVNVAAGDNEAMPALHRTTLIEAWHARWHQLRRLTLRGPERAVFLDRWGIDTQLFGLYVHHIAAPDPGLDLHDHPWPFITIILSGGYDEEVADARIAPLFASGAEAYTTCARGFELEWRRGSVHRMRMTEAHRITKVRPRTWTLVLRGRKTRQWGFYLPSGYVSQHRYDYATRRPCTEDRPAEVPRG